MSKPLAERFENKVDRTAAHHRWTGSAKADGSGTMKVGGRVVMARRVAWELTHGPLPAEAHVLRCPNHAACVNVAHLAVRAVSPGTAVGASGGRHNLPMCPTSFIGREEELAGLAALVEHRRVVTLTGAGGCGKTRLAAQLGAAVLERFPDGVWLVDLARASDPALVAHAVAAARGLGEIPGRTIGEVVVDDLRHRGALLIVDNCEHLIDPCAALVECLLAACPGLRVLTTSRAPLDVNGETVYRVSSLALPAHTGDVNCSSARLFIERAELAQPGLRVEPDRAVASICLRLDGIPLAIELAAARCRSLSPLQIAAQLQGAFEPLSDNGLGLGQGGRFGLLSGGPRSGLARHRTLLASIEWSHALLQAEEQAALRRLSVFVGGFTLTAAEAVCAGGQLDASSILGLVLGLVDKSLVEPQGGGERYRLLETIRQYAADGLALAGEVEEVRQRHARYYVELAVAGFAGLLGPDLVEWQRTLDSELDNLRLADDWLSATRQPDLALPLAGSLRLFWARGHIGEGAFRLRRALDLTVEGGEHTGTEAGSETGSGPRWRSRAIVALFEAVLYQGDLDIANTMLAEALAVDRQCDRGLQGELVNHVGWAEFVNRNDDAPRLMEEATDHLRAGGEPFFLAENLLCRGAVPLFSGRLSEARDYFADALEVARASRSPMMIGRALCLAGLERLLAGDLAATRRLLVEAQPLLVTSADHSYISWGGAALARLADVSGEAELALAAADSALAEARRRQQGFSGALAYWVALVAESRQGGALGSLPALGDAEATMASVGMSWASPWCRSIEAEHLLRAGDQDGARDTARRAVDAAYSHSFLGLGRGRTLLALARVESAVGQAGVAAECAHRALGVLAASGQQLEMIEAVELVAHLTAAHVGRRAPGAAGDGAVRLLSAAAAARERLGYPLPPTEAPAVDGDLAWLRGHLGAARFELAWADGGALDLDGAAAYASRGRGGRRRPEQGWDSLTPTELEVVRLVTLGLRNAEVATRMFVSPSTIKSHLWHVFAKLGVSSRAELASLTLRRNQSNG